jgi:modulator of FtsH protease
MQPELQSANVPYQSGSITAGQNRVLRNTYLLLAVSMVPTVIAVSYTHLRAHET